MEATNATFRNTKDAFDSAIKERRLSRDRQADNYAGHYMYMGTWDNKDQFKNINFRTYLK